MLATLTWIVDKIRNPGLLIAWGGYPALATVVFLETGALVFFLPGDSLLVIAGVYAAKGDLDIVVLNALLAPLAALGDACSYAIGRTLGARLFVGGGRLLRPEHLAAANGFYARHGGRAVILARFVPVVRTFVPVVAGIGAMAYPRFAAFNIVGAVAWVGSMTGIGWALGARFPWMLAHIEAVIVAVVAISLVPALVEVVRARRGAGPGA